MVNQLKRCNVIDFAFTFNAGFNCLMNKDSLTPRLKLIGNYYLISENLSPKHGYDHFDRHVSINESYYLYYCYL